MRVLKTFICFLFMIAVSIAPAAALPMCEKMTKQAVVSDMGDMPHCSGSGSEPSADPASTTNNLPDKKGCCCDGDMANACKTNCKTISGAATLTDAEVKQPDFELTFTSGKDIGTAAFIFEIITPPPRTCA